MTGDLVSAEQHEIVRKMYADSQKEIKRLKQALRHLRRRAESAEADKVKIEYDRDKYRAWVKATFNWFVDVHAGGKTPSMPYLIKEFTKLFNSVNPFYWG